MVFEGELGQKTTPRLGFLQGEARCAIERSEIALQDDKDANPYVSKDCGIRGRISVE
mgnify:CR=1 FL=1